MAQLLELDAQVPRALRLTLQGECAAHGDLFQRGGELRAHVLAELAALAPERLWLEKVRLDTRPPASVLGNAAAHLGLGADALADVQALLAEARHDEALLKDLREDFAQMLAKAPELATVVRQEQPLLRQVREGELGTLFDQVLPGLLARLASRV